MKISWIALIPFMVLGSAQTTATITRSITATGNATVSVSPDQAMVDVGVTTQAGTASDAANQNATQATAVISAIQAVIGQGNNVKTVNYSLNPVYSSGSNATIIGYQATNTVEATITDLTLIGKVIDVAIASGANRVNSIRFGLQNQDPIQAQALKIAAASALNQAKSIASGLGLTLGSVLHASEGSSIVVPTAVLVGAAPTVSTPVETGLVQVQGTVTVDVAIQ